VWRLNLSDGMPHRTPTTLKPKVPTGFRGRFDIDRHRGLCERSDNPLSWLISQLADLAVWWVVPGLCPAQHATVNENSGAFESEITEFA